MINLHNESYRVMKLEFFSSSIFIQNDPFDAVNNGKFSLQELLLHLIRRYIKLMKNFC